MALGVHVKDEPSLQQGLRPNPDSASSKLCALGKRLISEGVSKSVKWKHLAQVGAENMFFLFFFSQMFKYVRNNYFEEGKAHDLLYFYLNSDSFCQTQKTSRKMGPEGSY